MPLFRLETLAPSCVLSLKHDCSTMKCHSQGNVTSSWYSSCPAHPPDTAFLLCWSPCSACLVPFIWCGCGHQMWTCPAIHLLLSAWAWPLVSPANYSLPRIALYVFRTPSPNTSPLFKILWREVLMELLTKETCPCKKANTLQWLCFGQGVYYTQDISLRFSLLREDWLCQITCGVLGFFLPNSI